jgi:uncharacterized protein
MRSIVHIEIPSADREANSEFYAEMFGWSFTNYDEFNYTTFEANGIGGGLNPVKDDFQPGDVIFYVESSDIDADLKKAEALGGKVSMPKHEVPGFGHFAIFTDLTGNRIGLWMNQTS